MPLSTWRRHSSTSGAREHLWKNKRQLRHDMRKITLLPGLIDDFVKYLLDLSVEWGNKNVYQDFTSGILSLNAY